MRTLRQVKAWKLRDFSKETGKLIGAFPFSDARVASAESSARETVRRRPVLTLDSSTFSLTDTLARIDSIKSQNDTDRILYLAGHLAEFFPGPLTVQKITNLDESVIDWELYAGKAYGHVLEALIGKFNDGFPFRLDGEIYVEIRRVFAVESGGFFCEAISVLAGSLIDFQSNQWVVRAIVKLLEILLRSDCLFAAIVEYSFENGGKLEREYRLSRWEKTVQVLVSLPNRVANVLSGKFPLLFKREHFCNVIGVGIIKAVELASELNGENFDGAILSMLLGKVVTHFSDNLKSRQLTNMMQVFVLLCLEGEKSYLSIWKEIFINLNRTAIEPLAVILLQNSPRGVNRVLHPDLINDENWRHVLCTKIPLLSYHDYKEPELINNLINYISEASQTRLLHLLLDLLEIWSDKSAINHTSIEQHLYVTRFVISTIRKSRLSDNDKIKVRGKFVGVSAHLESPLETHRTIGMVVAEIVFGSLESEPKLEFDWNEQTSEAKALKELLCERYQQPEVLNRTLGDVLKEMLAEETTELTYCIPGVVKKETEVTNEIVAPSVGNKGSLITIIDGTNFELDSDDDLEPYSIANDVAAQRKPPPAYLQDVREGLLDTSDPDIFTQALKTCERLVRSQLSHDDPTIGSELLEILVLLDPPFYIENFEQIVFRCCVTITCVYPKVYAEYLARQFHADVGLYSVNIRIFVLDVLSESAKILANIQGVEPQTEQKRSEPVRRQNKKTRLEVAEEVIRERLERKTRRFFTDRKVGTEKVNRFSEVAASYFYPLLRTFFSKSTLPKFDVDNVVLVNYLRTLSVLMRAAQNCPIASRAGKELLGLGWMLRHHKEAKVRLGVLQMIACVVINVPKPVLLGEFASELFELRLWLNVVMSANVQHGESNTDCRTVAECLGCLVDDVLKVQLS